MENFSLSFCAEIDSYCILIQGVKRELYKGINKKPFYYVGNNEVYLNTIQKSKLDSLITTVKAV